MVGGEGLDALHDAHAEFRVLDALSHGIIAADGHRIAEGYAAVGRLAEEHVIDGETTAGNGQALAWLGRVDQLLKEAPALGERERFRLTTIKRNAQSLLQQVNDLLDLARIDSGRMPLAKTSMGEFGLRGLMNYTKGENRDTGGNLYNIMPLNGKVAQIGRAHV